MSALEVQGHSNLLDISAQNIDCSGVLTINQLLVVKNLTINRTNNLADISILDDYLDHSACFFQDSYNTFGSLSNTLWKYNGGALAPNGKIYCIGGVGQLLIIDPILRDISLIDIPDGGGHNGCILSENGKLYSIPYTNNKIIVFNTNNNIFETSISAYIGYSGGVLAPNNKIYFIPWNASKFAVLDLTTNSVSIIDTGIGTRYRKYNSGTLGPDGNIYCAPSQNSHILRINTSTNTISNVGSNYGAGVKQKWVGAVLAPNGNIYFGPFYDNSILVYNIGTNTSIKLANATHITSSGSIYSGGIALGSNGKIYTIPFETGNKIIVVDPNSNTLSSYGNFGLDRAYFGCISGPNGNIYATPAASTTILEIIPSKKSNLKEGPKWRLEPYFNK